MHYVEGVPYDLMAQLLGASVSALKNARTAARALSRVLQQRNVTEHAPARLYSEAADAPDMAGLRGGERIAAAVERREAAPRRRGGGHCALTQLVQQGHVPELALEPVREALARGPEQEGPPSGVPAARNSPQSAKARRIADASEEATHAAEAGRPGRIMSSKASRPNHHGSPPS